MELPGAWLLLAPAGLLGLLAIAIPVAIHLISHGRGRRVLIGNIELVRAARQARVTTPRLTQWLLLLLRVLIILVATLLLAQLALQGLGSVDGDVSYVTPGWLRSAPDTERSGILSRKSAPRVLVAGYPPATDYAPVAPDPNYDVWPLLAERLSTLRHVGTVDVFAERSSAAFGAGRPALPNEVNWRLATVAEVPAAFESRGLVVYDRDRLDDVRRLERALEALKRHRVPRLEWQACEVDDVACREQPQDWVAWLSAAEPGGDIGNARLYRPRDPEWTLTLADPRYPEGLLDTVLSEEQRRLAWQQVPVSIDALVTGARSAVSTPLPNRPVHPWLGLLLTVLWAAERLLSEYRRSDDA